MILFGVASLLFLLMVVIAVHEEGKSQQESTLESLNIIGEYRLAIEGKSNSIRGPMKIDANRNPLLILEGHFDRSIQKGQQILMRLDHISIELYQNGKMIYSYGLKNDSISFNKSGGDAWTSYCLKADINENDIIKVVLRNPYFANERDAYDKFLDEFYIGDRMDLARKIFHKEFPECMLSYMTFLIGILILMDYIYFRRFQIEVERSVYVCAMLIILTGVWAIIHNPLMSLLILYRSTMCITSHILLYMTAPFEVYYHTFIMSGKRQRIARVLSVVGIITTMVSILLQISGRCDIMESFVVVKPIALTITVVTTICMIHECIQKKSRVYQLYLLSDLSFSIFCTMGTFTRIVRMKTYNFYFHCGFFLFAMFQFISISHRIGDVMKQSRSASEMQTELLQNNIAITLSQIQPHFMFNVLTAIQQLCETSPEKAKKSIDSFSRYLRGNIDSLGCKELILFRKEMEHVQCYLRLEQMRFDERIRVEYDLQESDFFIPSLTVQPIVENAVKHGLTKKQEGGCVIIRTQKTLDAIEICIQDDGAGFDPNQKKEDGHSHIGIENVRNRLKKMCNGEMEVKSAIGVGTTVTMRIPT